LRLYRVQGYDQRLADEFGLSAFGEEAKDIILVW
jgi:hypothetical protein